MLKLAAGLLWVMVCVLGLFAIGGRIAHALTHPRPPVVCVAQVTSGEGTFYQVQPLATTPADCSAAIGTLNSYGIGTVKAVNTVPAGQQFDCQGLIFADSGDIWSSPATGTALASWIQSTCEAGTYSAPTEPR